MSKTLPPLPENLPHVVRRIRACQCELVAQVVFEHALNSYAIAAIKAQGVPDKTGTAYADLHAKWRKGRQELANLTRAHERLKAQGVPAGWQLVPKEPTDEMFFDPDDACINFGESAWQAFCRVYYALLASAPPAPTEQVRTISDSGRDFELFWKSINPAGLTKRNIAKVAWRISHQQTKKESKS